MSRQRPPLKQKGLEEDVPTAPRGTAAPGAGSTPGRQIVVSTMSLKMASFWGHVLKDTTLCLKSNSLA